MLHFTWKQKWAKLHRTNGIRLNSHFLQAQILFWYVTHFHKEPHDTNIKQSHFLDRRILTMYFVSAEAWKPSFGSSLKNRPSSIKLTGTNKILFVYRIDSKTETLSSCWTRLCGCSCRITGWRHNSDDLKQYNELIPNSTLK